MKDLSEHKPRIKLQRVLSEEPKDTIWNMNEQQRARDEGILAKEKRNSGSCVKAARK